MGHALDENYQDILSCAMHRDNAGLDSWYPPRWNCYSKLGRRTYSGTQKGKPGYDLGARVLEAYRAWKEKNMAAASWKELGNSELRLELNRAFYDG